MQNIFCSVNLCSYKPFVARKDTIMHFYVNVLRNLFLLVVYRPLVLLPENVSILGKLFPILIEQTQQMKEELDFKGYVAGKEEFLTDLNGAKDYLFATDMMLEDYEKSVKLYTDYNKIINKFDEQFYYKTFFELYCFFFENWEDLKLYSFVNELIANMIAVSVGWNFSEFDKAKIIKIAKAINEELVANNHESYCIDLGKKGE